MEISVRNLSIDYPGDEDTILRVVKDISFEIKTGKRLAIVGPSGSGKSTILNALAGLLPPAGGSIEYDGLSVDRAHSQGLLGMVPQKAALLKWRTAEKNVALPLQLQKVSSNVIDKKVKELLELFGLSRFANYYPSQLSGGMQSRVSIARALATSPRILLLDECFGSLDELTRERLNLELSPMWHELGTTLVFVTHSVHEAVFLADEVLVLSALPAQIEGKVSVHNQQPRSKEFFDDEEFHTLVRQVRKLLGL